MGRREWTCCVLAGSCFLWACSDDAADPFGSPGSTTTATSGSGASTTVGVGSGGVGATAAAGGGAGVGGGTTGKTLRVMTVNLLTFVTGGSADERTQMVADAVIQRQPDVVALQEIAQSLTVSNRAEALAQLTGYAWGWQQAHDFGLYQEGTGYLSRWPVAWTESRIGDESGGSCATSVSDLIGT